MSLDLNTLLLGDKKLIKNDINGAMHHYHSILKNSKDHVKLYVKNFDLFCKNEITDQNYQFLKEICEFYFKDNLVYHNYAFSKAIKFTKFYKIKILKKKSIFKEKDLEIINDNLLQLILKKCLIVDLELETYLIKLRKKLLKKFLFEKEVQIFLKIYSFLISLAEQCFFNEFIFCVSDEEKKLLFDLEKKIKEKKNICEVSILFLSLYKPLYEIEYLRKTLENYVSNSNEFNEFLKFVFNDSKYEKKIIKSIKSISNFSNKTSKLIKKQYEENPYPRWRYTSRPNPGEDFNLLVKRISGKDLSESDSKNPKILIAGCGTGQQIVQYSGLKNSQIFAIDLSKVSLAYSIRKTEEMNIKNVNYYHLDLLDLQLLDMKFDMIICSGCLHHMEKPEDGLDSLLNVLKAKGLLFLGLYSRHARSHIKWAREYIKSRKINVTEENMKNLRTKIFTSQNKYFQEIRQIIDFFSLSRFRDLIFNYQEHTFDLLQIRKLLENKKLKFLAFDRLPSAILDKFRQTYLEANSEFNLELWNKFELTFPKIFAGMYNFWVEKK